MILWRCWLGYCWKLELCVENKISGWLERANDGGWGKPEDDKPDKSNSGRCLWLVPVGDIAHSPVSPSISFSLSFARSRLIKPFHLLLLSSYFTHRLGDRPYNRNTEVQGRRWCWYRVAERRGPSSKIKRCKPVNNRDRWWSFDFSTSIGATQHWESGLDVDMNVDEGGDEGDGSASHFILRRKLEPCRNCANADTRNHSVLILASPSGCWQLSLGSGVVRPWEWITGSE